MGYNNCFYLEEDEDFSNDMLEIVKMKLNIYIKIILSAQIWKIFLMRCR